MTDEQTVEMLFRKVSKLIGLAEEELGEMSSDQKDSIGSSIMAFWVVVEDKLHPREDGQTWRDIVRAYAEE